MVGCIATQGSLCGYTLVKSSKWTENHIVFNNRCVRKTEAANVARHSWRLGPVRRAATNVATDVVSGKKGVVNGLRLNGTVGEVGGEAKGCYRMRRKKRQQGRLNLLR